MLALALRPGKTSKAPGTGEIRVGDVGAEAGQPHLEILVQRPEHRPTEEGLRERISGQQESAGSAEPSLHRERQARANACVSGHETDAQPSHAPMACHRAAIAACCGLGDVKLLARLRHRLLRWCGRFACKNKGR